jgi:hypothetical protein
MIVIAFGKVKNRCGRKSQCFEKLKNVSGKSPMISLERRSYT